MINQPQASRAPLPCRSARLAASAFLDGDLPPDLTDQVEQHLSLCNQRCGALAATAECAIAGAGREPVSAVPEGLSERTRGV